ncbi:esterase/lipase family protein [Nocardia sp. NPDC059246]|uniref:esterase/lipase family protein n=1 Tax=unclassified Nocardia TaxID=2637762 RepID=UPI003694A131
MFLSRRIQMHNPLSGAGARTAATFLATLAFLLFPEVNGHSDVVAEGPPQTNALSAIHYAVDHPNALPIGMNDFGCKPSAAHPRPLILVNGTFGNMYMNWSMYSPQFRADGYCVFGLDYGYEPGSPPYWRQVGRIGKSAEELGSFVSRVRAATGATQVDLVTYSQGGIVALNYINQLGGADEVGSLIGIAPPSHGISVYGILPWIASNPTASPAVNASLPATIDVAAGSEFIERTAAGGLTRPNVRYVTVISRTDSVVQPEEARLPEGPNVTNVSIQDICSNFYGDHSSYIYNEIVLRLVRNYLDPDTASPPICHLVLPGTN